MELMKQHKIKNIWLNTGDANVDSSAVRKIFGFYQLPLIQIKKKSILKVNSVTLSGAGHSDATGHNWTIKLHNVMYNSASYYNSDKNANPTILCFNFDTKNTIQNGLFALELEPQDIINLELECFNEAGSGLIKNSNPFNIHLNILIEEIE
jgi:hypothetical protein